MRIVGNPPSGGKKPTTPTIGTATDGGTGTTVSVAFTPSTYIGKGTITYTATSSPGSITGTGSGSPITVSGLTTGTAYTFTVNGTTNYGVTSDSSAASNSVTPVSPSSFESIATSTPTSGTSVTFSSIPSTYKSLQLRILARDGFTSQLYIRFNNDSGSNYAWHRLAGDGSAVSASSGTSFDRIQRIGYIGGATYFAANIIDIIDYASTSKNKTVRSFNGYNQNDAANGIVNLESGLWMSTAAINSITIADENGNSFASGSSIALYGIKG